MTVNKAIKILEQKYWDTIFKVENLYEIRQDVTWQGDLDEVNSDIEFYEDRLESLSAALDELKSLVAVR